MDLKFSLFCVSFLLIVTHQRIVAQNTSGCVYPEYYFFDNDGDGYGTNNYTEKMLINLHPRFNNSNKGYVFAGTSIMYGCIDMAVSDLEIASLKEFVKNSDDCDDTDPDIHPNSIWYYDNDGDGDGDPNNSKVFDCAPDPKYVKRPAADCNENNNQIHSQTVWYLDSDGDGTGGSTEFTGCTPPSNKYILTTGDECDEDSNTLEKYLWYFDADGDGYAAANNPISTLACVAPANYYAVADDCDDNNPFLHPKTVWYVDSDGDGWGGDDFVQGCIQPSGYVSNTLDYDDQKSCITNIYPQTYYQDADNDGYGNPNVTRYCSTPGSYVANNSDCNDNDKTINPYTVWYQDSDGDGFGDQRYSRSQCNKPTGYVRNHSDIDDSNDKITNIPPQYFYKDQDGDGHGRPDEFVYYSEKPEGYAIRATDCDDTNPLMHNFTVWYIDQDGDGKGYNPQLLAQTNQLRNTPNKNSPTATTTITITGCYNGTAYVLNQEDYDDQDVKINHLQPQYFYWDEDQDHYGLSSKSQFQSEKPEGYALNDGDCNDQDPLLHPQTLWYKDSDNDSWGDQDQQLFQCEKPQGYVSNKLDFDDTTENITNIQPQNFYKDQDGDNYGNPSAFLYYSQQPQGYVSNALDCNDDNPSIHPDTVWYRDSDGDGWGGTVSKTQCVTPTGYVLNAEDYDDSTIHIDNRPPRNFYQDLDGDRYGNPNEYLYYSYQPNGYVTNDLDCDDTDKYISPQTQWFQDLDGDGLGDPNVITASCLQPEKHVDNNGDLSDQSQYITNIATSTFYKDNDGDGYGDPNNEGYFSFAPPDFSIYDTDCDDTDPVIHPQTKWYLDSDGDGFGHPTHSITACDPPDDYLLNNQDLDDSDPFITDIPGRYFFKDADGDSYGNPNQNVFRSYIPKGYVTNDEDCNDSNANIHPKTQWYEDRDGDGFGGPAGFVGCKAPSGMLLSQTDYDDSTDMITNIPPRYFYRDADGDGYGTPRDKRYYSFQPSGYLPTAGDCNDNDPKINPNTVWYKDKDQDGFGDPQEQLRQCESPEGYTDNTQDIDDNNPHISNIAPQNYYRDQDDDGYGTPADTKYQSSLPLGYVIPGGDCNDHNPLLHPATVWFYDFDQDGFGGTETYKSCLQPSGHVSNQDDLDDNQKYITDIQPQYFFRDFDEDGYGNPEEKVYYSLLPEGYVINDKDCDDTHKGKHPLTRWYRDQDGDGAGNEFDYIVQCEQPEGYVGNPTDCDDTNGGRLGGLVDIAKDDDFDFDPDTHYSDCAVEEFEEEEIITALDFDGKVYVDLDLDGMGDPEQPVDLEKNPEPNFAWSINNNDACPEEFGPEEFKGCPKPVVLRTELGKAINQILRLFHKDNPNTLKGEKSTFMEDQLLYRAKVGPNPTEDGMVYAQWDEPVEGFVNTVVVFGFNNNLLYKSPFEPEDPKTIKIDLSLQPPGMYFIQFYFADGRALTRKIIVQ